MTASGPDRGMRCESPAPLRPPQQRRASQFVAHKFGALGRPADDFHTAAGGKKPQGQIRVCKGLVHYGDVIDIADAAVRPFLEEHPRRAQNSNVEIIPDRQEVAEHADQDRKNGRVSDHPCGPADRCAFGDAVGRRIPDQPPRLVDLLHHRVAGIDARRAVDAFKLCAVANIDACWTHGDTLMTVYAVTRFSRTVPLEPAARLAPRRHHRRGQGLGVFRRRAAGICRRTVRRSTARS